MPFWWEPCKRLAIVSESAPGLWTCGTEHKIWTASFDETESDIFALQSSLATQVAGSLLDHLTSADEELLRKQYTETHGSLSVLSARPT